MGVVVRWVRVPWGSVTEAVFGLFASGGATKVARARCPRLGAKRLSWHTYTGMHMTGGQGWGLPDPQWTPGSVSHPSSNPNPKTNHHPARPHLLG